MKIYIISVIEYENNIIVKAFRKKSDCERFIEENASMLQGGETFLIKEMLLE